MFISIIFIDNISYCISFKISVHHISRHPNPLCTNLLSHCYARKYGINYVEADAVIQCIALGIIRVFSWLLPIATSITRCEGVVDALALMYSLHTSLESFPKLTSK